MTDHQTAVSPYDGPALAYGLWRDSHLVVVEATWAAAAADEIESIIRAKTWADAKVASDAARHIDGPLQDDLADYELDPDDPVVFDDIPGVGDGDWPPMPCLYTAECLPEEWPVGELYETTFNGEGVVIPVEDEQRLLAVARQAGAPLARDDALIGRLDPAW